MVFAGDELHQFLSLHVIHYLHQQRTWRWQRVPRSSRKLKPRCQQRVTWNVGCLFLVFVAGGASGAGAGVALRKGVTYNPTFPMGLGPSILRKIGTGLDSCHLEPGTVLIFWGCKNPPKEGLKSNQNRGHLDSMFLQLHLENMYFSALKFFLYVKLFSHFDLFI